MGVAGATQVEEQIDGAEIIGRHDGADHDRGGGQGGGSVVIDITQVGSDVVISGSGALDKTGLTYDFSTFQPAEVVPSLNIVLIGPDSGHVDGFSGFTGPSSLGTGGTSVPSSGSGDTFGIDDTTLDLPFGYTSGSPIVSTSTFTNKTIAELGFTPGAYVFSWNSSAPGNAPADDSITIQVGVPEPSTWAMMLLGFAGLSFVGYWRSRKLNSIAA